MVQENQIYYELKDGRYLNINLYEIRLEEYIINKVDLLNAFFFDCQCALFFLDINNSESFSFLKKIILEIDNNKFPYLKKIVVENKINLIPQISAFELNEYKNKNNDIEFIEISLKTGANLYNLLNRIYEEVNSNSPEKIIRPINTVARDKNKKILFSQNSQESISLILIGGDSVGKTNFFNRYFRNEYRETFLSTIGIDREITHLKIYEKNFHKLTLWDTPGQERFRPLPLKYYKNVDGILIFFDINEIKSFKDVSNWMGDIKHELEKENRWSDHPVIYLIGNKIDRTLKNEEEKITKYEKEKLVKQLGVKYYETSCKWNLNIEEVMARIIIECYLRKNKKYDYKIKKIFEEDILFKSKEKVKFEKLDKYINF